MNYAQIFVTCYFFWDLGPQWLTKQPEESNTGPVDTAFVQKRPEGKKQAKKPQPVHYRVVGRKPLTPATAAAPPAVVG